MYVIFFTLVTEMNISAPPCYGTHVSEACLHQVDSEQENKHGHYVFVRNYLPSTLLFLHSFENLSVCDLLRATK